MSTQQVGSAGGEPSSNKAEKLVSYLREQVESDPTGEVYFKSKFIASDIGLSSKEIGQLLLEVRDSVDDLVIEKWSYTSATTWRVTSD